MACSSSPDQKPFMMSRTVSVKVLLASLVFASPLLAHADAAQDATIKELIAVTHLDNLRVSLAQQATSSSIPCCKNTWEKAKLC